MGDAAKTRPSALQQKNLKKIFKKKKKIYDSGVSQHSAVGLASFWTVFFFLVLVLISVKTELYLGTWANVVIGLRVEVA